MSFADITVHLYSLASPLNQHTKMRFSLIGKALMMMHESGNKPVKTAHDSNTMYTYRQHIMNMGFTAEKLINHIRVTAASVDCHQRIVSFLIESFIPAMFSGLSPQPAGITL